METFSLYDFPEIYDQVRTPDQYTFESIYKHICDQLGRAPRSVMDPACGPATWLSLFAEKGVSVAGNDIDVEMIENAQEKCVDKAIELIVGDMSELQFKKGPFEVCFELAGTCGMLPDKKTFQKFLRSVVKNTSPGGLILLTVFINETNLCAQYPWLVGQWGPFGVYPHGQAWLKYEVLSTEPELNLEKVRRTVHTEGVAQCSSPLIDEYNMYSWPEEKFWKMISEIPELTFVSSFRYDEPDGIVFATKGELSGEVTVVLRREMGD